MSNYKDLQEFHKAFECPCPSSIDKDFFVWTTPFGRPVEPDVNKINTGSSLLYDLKKDFIFGIWI